MLDRGGVTYSTSEGPGGKAFWEHRNLFGAGERLTLTLEGGQKIQGATADFRKPGLTDPRLPGWGSWKPCMRIAKPTTAAPSAVRGVLSTS